MKKSVILLFLVAFLVRLIALNQSFWLDEATTAVTISKFSYQELIAKFAPQDFHPPFFYVFIKWWSEVLGTSETVLRMPSVLFSLLTGGIIYQIGKKLKDEKVGYWSAAFFLFNPLIMYYSQEARMYMMATFFIAVNFLMYLLIREKANAANIFAFVLSIFLSMITFYGSIFYVGSLIMYSFFRKEFKIFVLASISLIGSLALLYTLLSEQMKNSGIVLQEVKNWRSTLGTVTFKQLILFPLKFATGRISFDPKQLYFLLGGLWSMFLVFVALRNSKKNLVVSFMAVTPIILGIIFSLHTPLLQYFRFQFVIIFFSILLGIAAAGSLRIHKIVLTGLLIWSVSYLIFPIFHREDWKTLAFLLLAQNRPIYVVQSSSDPLTYYASSLPTRSLHSLQEQIPVDETIIVIPYTADIHGINYVEKLSDKYELVERKHVRGIDYEVWNKIEVSYAGNF